MSSEERYVFIAEWYDQQASLLRNYQITYHIADNSIEMVSPTQYDLKNRRVFLKRCQIPAISLSEFFVGSIVTIYARQLKVIDYGDQFTRRRFEQQRSRTFAMIKPDSYNHIGKILDIILSNGFRINNLRMHRLSPAQLSEFYAEHIGKPFYKGLVDFMSSDVAVGLELVAEDAVNRWRALIGPTNPQQAKAEAPNSIRALFGSQNPRNAVHGSDSAQSAEREIGLFFSLGGSSAVLNNCTCGIVKPAAIHNLGKIVDLVLEEGFEISAMQMFYLDKPSAQEFLEVYKGVLPEYVGMVEQLTAGPCVAIEVRQENAVSAFRELCGPLDPEVGKHLRPNTIRALFGVDRVNNSVHCTDLPEDGVLECEYFFKLLAGQ